ncbi:UBX domain containing protein [Histomonas meleagridis]|uniref:UBX domain containing protein n=1 Tax=Histomonas meleagridis TaxID=135588 RepID=UPI00355A1E7B|nr:UBX domain containing protein [Histomonas meleagridis]KAH0799929.1 UBX domain containing protein [Histomonas meleagridis]
MQQDPFCNNVTEALNRKSQHPYMTLIVSIETDQNIMNYFWDNPLVHATVSENFIILRISQLSNQTEITQFSQLFPVSNIPSLFVFGPNSNGVTYSWSDNYPSAQEFYNYFNKNEEQSDNIKSDISDQEVKSNQKTKIAVYFNNRVVTKEFPINSRLQELREWIESEFGPGFSIFLTHKRKSIDDLDDSLTIKQAQMCPSSFLRLIPKSDKTTQENMSINENEDLPYIGNEETAEVPVEDDQPQNTFTKYLLKFLSIFNPFDDVVEVEDFFQSKE